MTPTSPGWRLGGGKGRVGEKQVDRWIASQVKENSPVAGFQLISNFPCELCTFKIKVKLTVERLLNARVGLFDKLTVL